MALSARLANASSMAARSASTSGKLTGILTSTLNARSVIGLAESLKHVVDELGDAERLERVDIRDVGHARVSQKVVAQTLKNSGVTHKPCSRSLEYRCAPRERSRGDS